MSEINAIFDSFIKYPINGPANLIASIGSSTIARGENNVSTGFQRTWGGVLNVANMMSQGRFYVPQAYSRAVSGETSSAMVGHQLTEVLALNPRPRGCFFMPGSNDIQSSIAWSTTQANITAVVNSLLSNGIVPIIGIPQPSLGQSAAIQSQYARVARYLRDLSARTPACILVDPIQSLVDPTLTTYELLAAYADTVAPRIHLNHYGTQIYAAALVQALANAGWSPNFSVSLMSNGDLYDATNNSRGSLMSNGMMSGTGGALTAPATGVVPTGWNLTPSSVGGTVVASQNNGAGCVVTVSGTAVAGTGIILYKDLSGPELANIASGDTLECVVEASWGALTNISYVGLDFRVTQNAVVTDDYDGTPVSQSGPINAVNSAIIRPPARALTSAPTAIRARLYIYPEANATMSGSVSWKSCSIRKVI